MESLQSVQILAPVEVSSIMLALHVKTPQGFDSALSFFGTQMTICWCSGWSEHLQHITEVAWRLTVERSGTRAL